VYKTKTLNLRERLKDVFLMLYLSLSLVNPLKKQAIQYIRFQFGSPRILGRTSKIREAFTIRKLQSYSYIIKVFRALITTTALNP